jgi:hypothetical protein
MFCYSWVTVLIQLKVNMRVVLVLLYKKLLRIIDLNCRLEFNCFRSCDRLA